MPKDIPTTNGSAGSTRSGCSAAGPIAREAVKEILKYLDDLPDDWSNYSPHWRCGYNQARNKVAALLKARTPNEKAEAQCPGNKGNNATKPH